MKKFGVDEALYQYDLAYPAKAIKDNSRDIVAQLHCLQAFIQIGINSLPSRETGGDPDLSIRIKKEAVKK